MTAEPDDLVPGLLGPLRGGVARTAEPPGSLGVEMAALRQHLAGPVAIQDHDPGETPR